MEDSIMQFLSWQFVLFCLALAAITFVVRRFVEYFEKDVPDLKLWNDLILPILPVFLGGGIASLVTMYPYPEGLHSVVSRGIWGTVAGLLSGLVYRVAKTLLSAKLKVSLPNETETPIDESLVNSVRDSIKKD